MRDRGARMGRIGRTGQIILAGVLAAALTVALAAPSTASSGSIGPSDTSTGWSGKTFTAGATPSPAACTSVTCDYFTLSVAVPSGYWSDHDGHATVSIHWGSSGDNFDLYVSRAGSSASSSSTSEAVSISDPSGTYSITVVPKLVTASGYSGSASFSSVSKPQPASTGSGGGSGSSGGSGSGTSSGGSAGGTSSGGKTGGSGGSSGGGTVAGTGSAGGSTGGAAALGQGPSVFPWHPEGPAVSGGYSPGGLYQVPGSGVFHYTGPYHFAPPFSFGGPGKLHPINRPRQPQPQPNPANPGRPVVVGQPHTQTKPARIQAAPAANPPTGIPEFVWVLIPAVLILLAGAGAVVFEPESQPSADAPDGTATRAERPTVVIPPGPFVLLGFGVRRVARAIMNLAGGLFGGTAAGEGTPPRSQ